MMQQFLKTIMIFCMLISTDLLTAQIVASEDVYLCEPTEITLQATANGTSGTDSGISSDDTFGGLVNLGFNFDFYGDTYNQCVISSNNYLSFNAANAGGYSGWNIGAAVPNNFDAPMNAILCPWQDINPGIGGNIQYSLSGDAPNRVFTVTFCAIPMFSCTDICYTSQIKLFETSNIIETHISEKPLCATWNDGAAIHALHNNTGTIANVVTGPDGIVRNFPNQWTALQDGYRFTPNGPNDYIIEQIPYQPVITGNTVTWLDVDGNIVGSGNTLTVNPTESTTYYAQAQLCEGGGCSGNGGGTVEDEVSIFFEEISIDYETTSASCGWENNPDGQIISSPVGTGPFDFIWTNENGEVVQETIAQNTDILNNIPPGNYILSVSTQLGCFDEETISVEMDGVMPEEALAGDDQEICSTLTTLSANSTQAQDNVVQWELISGSGIISDIDNPSSNVTGLSIGENVFQWSVTNDCGTNTDQVTITVLDGNPVISEPLSPVTCLLNTSLNASVQGDVMVWSGSGPGNINFSSPNDLSTNVTVDQYGLYTFNFMGCAGTQTVSVEFVTETPQIINEETVYCDFQTELEVNYIENINGWSLFSSPNGSNVTFSSPNDLSTNVTVDQYGTYQFMFEACDSYDVIPVTFAPDEPTVVGPQHQDCILYADLVAYTEAENGGPWTQIFGPSGVVFSDQWSPEVQVTVPDYGIYMFQYSACNIDTYIEVGFSCELVLPNVITPNNDGINDEFIIDGLDPTIYTNSLFTVFNRWGGVVYIESDYGLNDVWWDGEVVLDSYIRDYSESSEKQLVNDGVYYYVLDVFNQAQNQKEYYTGHLTILKD